MFELTNAQRKCFGLHPIESNWIRIELKAGPYDYFTSIAYLDGNVVKRYITTGNMRYQEWEMFEQLSDDLLYLLPKTTKGTLVKLSGPTLSKRTPCGMCLNFYGGENGFISLYSYPSQRDYFSTTYESISFDNIDTFTKWVDTWCKETTDADLQDVADFSVQPKKHVKFLEGDVFRFKLDRRLYGYGRVLLDYNRMRKTKEPFWDILMGKPVAISIYHIATPRNDVTVDELKALPSLPSNHMMDNRLFYGEYEIIGHIPITPQEDYPIMYGGRYKQSGTHLQCGHRYLTLEEEPLNGFLYQNSGLGFKPIYTLPVLLSCIQAGSNEPYWYENTHRSVDYDLRNPKLRLALEQVCAQFAIDCSVLLK